MSERARAILLFGLLLLGAPLHAQDRERLLRRQASLTARIAAFQASQAMHDSLRFEEQRRVVVSAGAVHVALPEWAAEAGRRNVPQLAAAGRERYGDLLDSQLRDTLFIWIEDSIRGSTIKHSDMEWRLGGLHGRGSVERAGAGADAWLTWVPSAALEAWAQTRLAPELSQWLGPTNPAAGFASTRDGIVRELVSSPSSRGSRCLNGAMDECKLLLQVVATEDPLLDAYDPSDFPGLVRGWRSEIAAGRSRCVNGGDIAACRQVLQRPDRRPVQAASNGMRQSLFAYALMRGGEGAWSRSAVSAGGPLSDQLAAIAGVPVDTLISAWQRDLRSGYRTAEAGLGTGYLGLLLWAIAASLFFAWRYRWRHV